MRNVYYISRDWCGRLYVGGFCTGYSYGLSYYVVFCTGCGFGVVVRGLRWRVPPRARIPRPGRRGGVLSPEVEAVARPGYLRPYLLGRIVGIGAIALLRRSSSNRGIFSVVLDRRARRASVHLRRRREHSSSAARRGQADGDRRNRAVVGGRKGPHRGLRRR